jgi:hypothetical protein
VQEPGDRSERDRRLVVLASIDHHVAVLRARAGQRGYADWYARRPKNGSLVARVLPIHAALEEAGTYSSKSREWRHVRGSLATAVSTLWQASPNVPGSFELFSEVFELFRVDPEFLRGVRPDAAYALGAFDDSPCQVTNLVETFSFDEFQVTTLSLEFDVSRGLDAFPTKLDPRIWDDIAPDTYQHVDPISSSPNNLFVNPPLTPPLLAEDELTQQAQAGQSWPPAPGLLYENARVGLGLDASDNNEVMDFKNVLAIGFTANTSAVTLDYRLVEGLSVEILGSKRFCGGLDRDSGEVIVEKTTDTTTHHKVKKSVRLAQPADRRDLLNWSMAQALPYWLKNLVLLGVCD